MPSFHIDYLLVQKRLLYKGRLVIPKGSELIPIFYMLGMTVLLGGHSSFVRTQKGDNKCILGGDEKRYPGVCAKCAIYQQNKYSSLSPNGLLQPLLIPDQVWEELMMDFAKGLPKSDGFDTILVVVDRLNKYNHFVSLQHPFTTQGVPNIFVKEIVRLHGVSKSIVSYREKVFLSHL